MISWCRFLHRGFDSEILTDPYLYPCACSISYHYNMFTSIGYTKCFILALTLNRIIECLVGTLTQLDFKKKWFFSRVPKRSVIHLVCESLCTSGCTLKDLELEGVKLDVESTRYKWISYEVLERSVSPKKWGSQLFCVAQDLCRRILHVYVLPNPTCLAKRLGHLMYTPQSGRYRTAHKHCQHTQVPNSWKMVCRF